MQTSPASGSAASTSSGGGNARTSSVSLSAAKRVPVTSCEPTTRSRPAAGSPSQSARTAFRMCVPASQASDVIWS